MYAGFELLRQKKIKRIIMSRPTVEMGREMGFLPGPQPLHAKVLTPDGWTTMGELKVGSKVISRDGKPTEVLGIYPKGVKQVYKVTTSEGSVVECCEDHLWLTQTAEEKKRSKPGKVRTTKEIYLSLWDNKVNPGYSNHYLPRVSPVEFAKQELPLSPYTLGVILGDGSISNFISFAAVDPEIVQRVNAELQDVSCEAVPSGGISYNIRQDGSNPPNNKVARQVKVTDLESGSFELHHSIGQLAVALPQVPRATLQSRCQFGTVIEKKTKYEYIAPDVRWTNPVKEILFNLGLEGTKAWTKFIPEQYLYSSVEDRIALLQGLMDTDGTTKKSTGEASFCTTSLKLAQGVVEIVRSLGGRAIICSRDRIGKESLIDGQIVTSRRISYEFTISLPPGINPFHLARKAERYSSKYTYQENIISIEPSDFEEVQCILVDNPEHLYVTDNYVVTHNTLENKFDAYLAPLVELTAKLGNSGDRTWKSMTDGGQIKAQPLQFIRGLTFDKQDMFLVDEAQGLLEVEMLTVLTRMAEGSRLIFTGDLDQIDDRKAKGLEKLLRLQLPFVNHYELVENQRNPRIQEILAAWKTDGNKNAS